jgi:hypothetical protein
VHLPAWLLSALVAIGGWKIFEKLALPILKHLYGHFLGNHDAPVWQIVRQPKYRKYGSQNNWTYQTQIELPYTAEEIAFIVSRSVGSVLASLRRLEKQGKVVELHDGWKRKDK